MDIAQNSIKANASLITIIIDANSKSDTLNIKIDDNGKGMSEAFLKNVCDPFSTTRTTRKVGLGIPMFKGTAKQCDGDLIITSKLGKGTCLTVDMKISHIDRPPLGAISETMHILVVSNPQLDFYIDFRCDDQSFCLDTVQLKQTLDPVPLDNSEVSTWIIESLKEATITVFGGKI